MKELNNGRRSRTLAFAVVFISILSCVVIGTFAKYSSQLFGSGKAPIAKFTITATASTTGTGGSAPTFDLSEGATTSAEYKFKVTNESEVAVTYDVKIKLPSGSPTDVVSFILDGDNTKMPTVNGLEYTFADIGSLAIGESKNHTLTVSATSFDSDVTMTGITVSVVATQIQPE